MINGYGMRGMIIRPSVGAHAHTPQPVPGRIRGEFIDH